MRYTDFTEAELISADFTGVDMSGAYMCDAYGNIVYFATPEQSIENLDRVRDIILGNKDRLENEPVA